VVSVRTSSSASWSTQSSSLCASPAGLPALSWGGFEAPSASFLCVPLIHDVLGTHGANAVYAAADLVSQYDYEWKVWVDAYKEDFAARGITIRNAGVGRGYIDPGVQNRLLCNPPDGQSTVSPFIPGQIQLCYRLMRDDHQGVPASTSSHTSLSVSTRLSIPSRTRSVQQSSLPSTSSSTVHSHIPSALVHSLTHSSPQTFSAPSLPSSSSSSSRDPPSTLSSFLLTSSSSSSSRANLANERSWGQIPVDGDPRSSYFFVPLIRAALQMDSPSVSYRVQRELDSIPGYERAFDQLVQIYRADFTARKVTPQTLINRRGVDLDGYIHPDTQVWLLFTQLNIDEPGESRVDGHVLMRLQSCMSALINASINGRL